MNTLLINHLLEYGKSLPKRELIPVYEKEAAIIFEKNTFAFALSAVLDRGTKTENIWTIPHYLNKLIGDLNPYVFEKKSDYEILQILKSIPYRPRYITAAPRTIKELSFLVVNEFGGDTSRIWTDRNAVHVIKTFNRLYGVGPGIATMVVLLIRRLYDIDFEDIDQVDVKPDVHIVRVFKRFGFINYSDENEAIVAARKLNPNFPGALDAATWFIGRRWCFSSNPNCNNCPMNDNCPKKL